MELTIPQYHMMEDLCFVSTSFNQQHLQMTFWTRQLPFWAIIDIWNTEGELASQIIYWKKNDSLNNPSKAKYSHTQA